ncbi:hypothetical protein, partial [Pseudomonas aeruginosa]|uniref:hypothetical protein n=1 Tax=Pseudomonas aeruginosa TaxID=287 RepID=UPI001968BBBF
AEHIKNPINYTHDSNTNTNNTDNNNNNNERDRVLRGFARIPSTGVEVQVAEIDLENCLTLTECFKISEFESIELLAQAIQKGCD